MADIADRAEALEANQREDALAAFARSRQEQLSRESLSECEACEVPITVERQVAVPGVRLCINCQSRLEQQKRRGLA
ncbi:conjugal transfer protein TraR [Limnohabitans sp. TS-CS-82]|uniref:TraR/DksA C4-type zinc finger protein n=1 Tax=Limnohabitans sp. TS-CS-82 TaxID=2094193 RepID=UPI000CF20048|nr:TraR/DksA C4-type zinc finger protein [Limnohabitans sp. TS-CS-82]PQA82768.1 conjugal transfer protein TraR [Limnohabitans sp. TS-CS-82]